MRPFLTYYGSYEHNKRIINSLDVAVYLVDKHGIVEQILNTPAEENYVQSIKKGEHMEIRQIITDDEEFRKNMEAIEQVLKTKKTCTSRLR